MKGIEKSYGKVQAVRGIDLDIAEGEFAVLVGPSGCGKATLLRQGDPAARAAALEAHAGRDVTLGLRPEHITGSTHAGGRREHLVAHQVIIDLVQPTGTRLYGAFALAGTEVLAELQAHDVERPGETIEVMFDMQRAILVDPESERVL